MRSALAFNTGRIVFTSTRDGNSEIYVMDADGGNQENLTNHPAHDYEPDWSPDRTKIAFVSTRNGRNQIYVMDADGKNPTRLTDGPLTKWAPDWSPDGRRIAFTVQPAAIRESYIAVIDADGNNRVRFKNHARHPSWSPDGRKIAFSSERDGEWWDDIYVIGVDGQGLRRVTHELWESWGGHSPAFSPDGKRIAYVAIDEIYSHIFVVGADGKNRVRLTQNQQHHGDPAWSVSGRRIAYVVWDNMWDDDAPSAIHLMTSDGEYLKQLSVVDGPSDYHPDMRSVGLAVSLQFQNNHNLGEVEETRIQPPIVCPKTFYFQPRRRKCNSDDRLYGLSG